MRCLSTGVGPPRQTRLDKVEIPPAPAPLPGSPRLNRGQCGNSAARFYQPLKSAATWSPHPPEKQGYGNLHAGDSLAGRGLDFARVRARRGGPAQLKRWILLGVEFHFELQHFMHS